MGITVNVVAPGGVQITELSAGFPQTLTKMLERTPMHRLATAADVADVGYFSRRMSPAS